CVHDDTWTAQDTRYAAAAACLRSFQELPVTWMHLVSYFFGGAFLANAIPHFVSGQMGRPFQSPFARPPGEGLSSSRVNVLWGAFNFVVAYGLLCHVEPSRCATWLTRERRPRVGCSCRSSSPATSGSSTAAMIRPGPTSRVARNANQRPRPVFDP